MRNDLRNYLKSDVLYWYRKSPEENKQYSSYRDCYAFTQNYFTCACYVKPEFANISQEQRDEIYSDSHIVFCNYCNNFKFDELTEENKKMFDETLEKADKFFEKVNKGEVAKLKRAKMHYGKFALLYKNFETPIIFVNSSEILDPIINLLENLMDCACLSDEDEMRLYFDEDEEIVYLAWYEDATKRDYWVAGIKPVAFADNTGIIDAFKELVALSKFEFQKYHKENINGKKQEG